MPDPQAAGAPLRAAVVGVGYLGRFHAEKYAALPGVELVAVVDRDPTRARHLARACGCAAFTDHRALPADIDLASVVVPTLQHFAVAHDLIQAGIHVMVEKPVTADVDDARALVRLAESSGCVFQVGHLERFNPAVEALGEYVDRPRHIEALRLSPFRTRGTEVSVVLDLMIHDIDLVLGLVDAPVRRIKASGMRIRTGSVDVANALLEFADGGTAQITASRVSLRLERRMYVRQADTEYVLDLHAKRLERRPVGGAASLLERLPVAPGDALGAEIGAFVDCVRRDLPPRVDGRDGLLALQVAMEIERQIQARLPEPAPNVDGR